MLKKCLFFIFGIAVIISASLFVKSSAQNFELDNPIIPNTGDKACYMANASYLSSVDRESVKAHNNFILFTLDRALNTKSVCYPMIYQEKGVEKDACLLGYFFNRGIPTVYYIGPTVNSVDSRGIWTSCDAMLKSLKKDYPNTVLPPATQKTIKILQQHYYN